MKPEDLLTGAVLAALLLSAAPGFSAEKAGTPADDVDILTAPFALGTFATTSTPVPIMAGDAPSKLGADPLIANVARALRTHPQVQAALERGTESGYAVRAAQAALYPKLDVGVDLLGSWTNRTLVGANQQRIPSQTLYRPDAYASAEQLLFDAGSTFARISAARHRMDESVSKAEVDATRVAVRAIAAYWDVLRLREAARLADANVTAHDVLFQRVQVRVEAGAASEGDRLRAEARTNNARSQAALTMGALSRAEAEYAAVFGAAPDSLVWPTVAPDLGSNAQAIVDRALAVGPSLHAKEASVEAARKDAAAEGGGLWPNVSVAVNARQYDVLEGRPRLYDVGVQLVVRYRLFSGGQKTAEVAQARSRVRQAELARDLERRELEAQVRASVSDIVMQVREYEASRRAAETSQQTYAVYVEQYGVGRRTLDDLLDALSEAYQASGQLLQARVNMDVGRYALVAQTGDLLALLGTVPPAHMPR